MAKHLFPPNVDRIQANIVGAVSLEVIGRGASHNHTWETVLALDENENALGVVEIHDDNSRMDGPQIYSYIVWVTPNAQLVVAE